MLVDKIWYDTPMFRRCFITFLCLYALFSHAEEQPPRSIDIPLDSVHIGCAQYPQGPTGVTVFYFPKRVQVAVDIRGGAEATYFTPGVMEDGNSFVDAIVFSGGSILGLEAISGVNSAIFVERDHPSDWTNIPLVSGAIIYDFTDRKDSTIYPDKNLGQQAFERAKPGRFLLGQHGAGRNATVGKIHGREYAVPAGQGGAFAQYDDLSIAAFTVVNAVGVILDAQGAQWQGHYDKNSAQSSLPAVGNTTLSLVVINQQLTQQQLKQLAKQIHNSLAQVIYPFGTRVDGDVLYLVSTNEIASDAQELSDIQIGMLASEVLHQAVYAVFE